MRKLYSLLLFLLLPVCLFAQVTSDPVIVQHNQPVTLYYNAAEGQSTLQGATKVYMHAGVVTGGANSTEWSNVVGTWGQDNGVGLMEKVAGQTNLWKITLPSPREYFNVPANQTIYRIGMVFRNADGTQSGRGPQGGDIFIPVSTGFNVIITQPSASTLFVQTGQQLTLTANTTAPADITVMKNGQQIASVQNQSVITQSLTFNGTSGRDRIIVKATSGSSTAADTLDAVYDVPSPQVTVPAGLKQGINFTGSDEATLVLFAKDKQSVYVVGDFTNWSVDPAYLMNRDGNLFWLTLDNLDPNKEYAYYYLVDETIKIADPFSEKILDAGEDHWLSSDRYPNLRPFPTAAATDRLTAFTLNEEEYNWQITDFEKPKVEDLIIYEVLVRDFSEARTYQAIIDRLDYLDSLGITALQLMPVMEFNGNESWGYNPTFQTSLDKYYGPKNKLKELVDKAHARGIAVVLDIALNHQDFPAPFIKMWANGYGASASNPFFNVSPTHPFNVFTDMNHESVYTQAFIDQVNRYWLEEYKIDGYRFDLSKGFTQKNSGNDVGLWNQYDQSRINLLKRMADEIWEVDPTAYVILEHLSDNEEEKVLANYGMLLWGGLSHTYYELAKGVTTGTDISWLSYKARGFNDPHVVGYMESHDEERLMYKVLTEGRSSGSYNTRTLTTALQRAKMAAALFIPIPGPKMIWQFGELGYDISIEEGGRTANKPVKWDYLDQEARQELFRVYSALNHLKQDLPVFETNNFSINATGAIKSITLRGEDMNVVVVANTGLTASNASVAFPETGEWHSYFTKTKLNVTGTNSSMLLSPGEYRLYTDQPIYFGEDYSWFLEGSTPTGINDKVYEQSIRLVPNPVEDQFSLTFAVAPTRAVHLQVTDLMGRQINTPLQISQAAAGTYRLNVANLATGLYLLRIQEGDKIAIKRFVKH